MTELEGTNASAAGHPVGRKRSWQRGVALALLAAGLALGVAFLMHLLLPRNFAASGAALPLSLPSGPFQTLYYCGDGAPRGVVILGTGDGGWSYWEEKTAQHLAQQGYAVGGWDCRRFADTRSFEQDDVVRGFRAAVDAVQTRAGVTDVPVWYAGWSTGAEQAVAAAASPERTPRLVGLLLAAPGRRGRYGITTSDLLGIEPNGAGSFALADLAAGLDGVRVVQFAAGLDPLDDVEWLQSVRAPHQLVELPETLHDMGGAGDEFLAHLDRAMAWTLNPSEAE